MNIINQKIKRVAVVGGTHGNELTGAYLVKKWKKSHKAIARSTFLTEVILANPKAFQVQRRYIDKDLNRCFNTTDLQNEALCDYEEIQAKWLYQKLGPESSHGVDFLLDLHTTGTNVGLTIILLDYHPFNWQLAAYLCSWEPTLKVDSLAETEIRKSLLNSLCEWGFAIEVGPIVPGTLNAALFQKTEALVTAILDYLDKFNRGQIELINKTITAYRHVKFLDYPRNLIGEIEGMIHPLLQGRDYQELKPGAPIFLTFDGQTLVYEENDLGWPVFINEAAYYEKGIALCLTKKEKANILGL